ncbi:HI1506-related protein [Ferrimonas sp.]|uniref:HI1506-related protein n=1 Tax=Ferrimonas sp. TaxID=2080861 RepID=UPI003A9094DD
MAKTILVTCLANSGYRRAGLAFQKGENHLEAAQLSQAQLAAIEGDHRLSIAQADPEGPVVENRLGDGLDSAEGLNLALVEDELLRPFVAVIDQLARSGELTEGKKPKVDELAFETEDDQGKAIKVKPTAAQRDAAWEVYQQLIQQPQAGAAEQAQGEG